MYDPRCSVWKVWSPWRLCTHIAGYWFWEGGKSPWGLWTCDPKCSVWEEVDLETVDMWPHVYDLGGHPGYFRH